MKPNVSYCEDKKDVHYNYVEPMKAGSFYYSDGTYSNKLDTERWCIGVCVIPPNFLPDKKARIMSLKEMDFNNPENGSLKHIKMYFGQYGVDISLPNLNKVTTIDPNSIDTYEGTTIGSNRYGYLSSDRTDTDKWKFGIVNNVDICTHWHKDVNVYLPSPYMKIDGKDVLCPEYNSSAMSDFDGKGNTAILTSLHTAEDWKNASKITNDSGQNYSPAAVCCARYKTEGTKSGDWYLPSIGELGFIAARFNEIQDSLLEIGGNKAISFGNNEIYWSSSKYSTNSTRYIYTAYFFNYNYANNRYAYAIAFLMV